ncbi:MAG: hypothetical protein JXX29_16880 [Deltaproteobacteria bacterium]|nr:hypothetical protein [Deltaproteobacteria bacterium]MBN2673361.1 hypothetical protein [Deltaproteobacteria bacterium]
MKNIQTLIILISFIISAFAFSACDSEEGGTHDLVVHWNIAGLNVCKAFLPEGQYAQDELVFTTVEVNIYEDETEETAIQAPITANCGAGQTRITRLDRGSYFVTVDAFTDYDGSELAFFRGESEVSVPAPGNVVDIPLMVGDGKIEVTWQFAGGMTCGLDHAGEIADIVVSLDGVDYEAACGDGRIVIEDVFPDSEYRITAVALNKDGDVVYDAIHDGNPFEVLPGQVYPATVVFQ